MAQNVRQYTTQQLLDRVASLPSFKGFPKGYWLIGIRSNEVAWNTFDDKAYLFKGQESIEVYKITTEAGTDLLNPSNSRGEAILKADEIYYNSWVRRLHRGKVLSWCQAKPILIYRDNDRDRKAEQLGTARLEIVGINIHPSSYVKNSQEERLLIGPWSQGCQVFAKRDGLNSFNSFMKKTETEKELTYAILNEFDPSTTKVSVKPLKLMDVGTLDNPQERLLSDEEVEKVLSSINESSSFESQSNSDSVDNSLNENTGELIVGTKEKPSTNTIVTSGGLQTSGIGSLIASIYVAIKNPENLPIVILCVVIGVLLVGLGVYNYRQSSKEKLELNTKKLELLADATKSNADLQ